MKLILWPRFPVCYLPLPGPIFWCPNSKLLTKWPEHLPNFGPPPCSTICTPRPGSPFSTFPWKVGGILKFNLTSYQAYLVPPISLASVQPKNTNQTKDKWNPLENQNNHQHHNAHSHWNTLSAPAYLEKSRSVITVSRDWACERILFGPVQFNVLGTVLEAFLFLIPLNVCDDPIRLWWYSHFTNDEPEDERS